ncbi:NADPH-dependent diflavin oxidoreductase 1 [Colias croceus]|uniref:NADPH-dependent diflavin oxidoreductase 1 n=1 Tax=Colias crocea TaxID=72248 RepID=UPI001E27ABAE|nr:NADPH-dependent diflavin oxidoreductase 1 [Colias croceus]XP_045506678.1 NADPH-dependent diflavin oxidoreductase 1 [Colias croceus]
MTLANRIVILYGSQTYTAQEYAERIWRTTKLLDLKGPVQAMDDYPVSRLIHEEYALFVCSTTGEGDEPDNMKTFWKFLLRKNLPAKSLTNLKFGVIGLGDSSYSKFNFAAKKLHKRLLQLGAQALHEIALCDYQHDLGHDAVMIPWLKTFLGKIKPDISAPDIGALKFVPRWKVSLTKTDVAIKENGITKDIYFGTSNTDHFVNPLHLEIESNKRITHESHFQDVRLTVFKSVTHDNINYNPGDVFNIRPRNSKDDIADLFNILASHGIDIKPHYMLHVAECHEEMPVPPFLQQPLPLYIIAEQYWDLKAYPTQYVFSLLAQISDDKLERDKCIELCSTEGQEEWLNYCRRPKRTILEVLHDFHKSAAKLTIEVLFELFSTIKPRSFSIASSCLPSQGEKIDILVAVVEYQTKIKKPRQGLCSQWLKTLNVGDRVYGWIKKGVFRFPAANIPIILIGPGTGLAPFRSLIQERVNLDIADRNIIHLFFGCRYKEKDFHCREELEGWEKEGKISLYCAFSRDQEDKEYVQHKIAQNKEILRSLIINEGAYIYIAGNAKNMPNNVKDAFVDEVLSEIDDAKNFMQNMTNSGRFQTETW